MIVIGLFTIVEMTLMSSRKVKTFSASPLVSPTP